MTFNENDDKLRESSCKRREGQVHTVSYQKGTYKIKMANLRTVFCFSNKVIMIIQ